jgi:hypothetical protein
LRKHLGSVKREIHPIVLTDANGLQSSVKLTVHVIVGVIVFVMHTGGQRRDPLLVKLAFLQDLEPRVEVVQFNGRLIQVQAGRLFDCQRQVAQVEVIVTVAQFEAAQRRFRQGQGFEILPVAKINIGKTNAGTPNRFAIARRVDNICRQRRENAAVAFDLVQRQRRGFFRCSRGGGGCRRGRFIGGDVSTQTRGRHRRHQQRRQRGAEI